MEKQEQEERIKEIERVLWDDAYYGSGWHFRAAGDVLISNIKINKAQNLITANISYIDYNENTEDKSVLVLDLDKVLKRIEKEVKTC
jgi:hypothetical protein